MFLPSLGAEVTIAGELCWRGALDEHRTVQVLIHGATYSRLYWQDEEQPFINRYASVATLSGFVTFAVDRLGEGASTRLPGDQITVDTNAEAIYGVVQALRSGEVEGAEFGRIILVGHSLGSITSIAVASDPVRFPDAADGVILTGNAHAMNLTGSFGMFGGFTPLGPSPEWPGDSYMGYPSYFTSATIDDRLAAFYYDGVNDWGRPTVDDAVVERDEATKQAMSLGEMGSIGDLSVVMNPYATPEEIVAAIMAGDMFSPRSLGIEVPVLLVMGEYDALICRTPAFPDDPLALDCSSSEAVVEHEAPFYSEAACLQAVVVRDTGHDVNLHTSALVADAAMLAWATAYVGVDARRPPLVACP